MEQLLADTCIEAAELLDVEDIELGGAEHKREVHDSICVGNTPAGRNIWVNESTLNRTYTATTVKIGDEVFSIAPIEVASITTLIDREGEEVEVTDKTARTDALVRAIRAKREGR